MKKHLPGQHDQQNHAGTPNLDSALSEFVEAASAAGNDGEGGHAFLSRMWQEYPKEAKHLHEEALTELDRLFPDSDELTVYHVTWQDFIDDGSFKEGFEPFTSFSLSQDAAWQVAQDFGIGNPVVLRVSVPKKHVATLFSAHPAFGEMMPPEYQQEILFYKRVPISRLRGISRSKINKEPSHAISSRRALDRRTGSNTVKVLVGDLVQTGNPALRKLTSQLDLHPGADGSDTHDTGSGQEVHGSRGQPPLTVPEDYHDLDNQGKLVRIMNDTVDYGMETHEGLDNHQAVKAVIVEELGMHLDNTFSVDHLNELVERLDFTYSFPSHEMSELSTPGEHVAHRLVKTWAISSSDSVASSVALQLTVAKKFGLNNEVGWASDKAKQFAETLLSRHSDVFDSFVGEIYDTTQRQLTDFEIDSLVLYRGMGWGEDESTPFDDVVYSPEIKRMIKEGDELYSFFHRLDMGTLAQETVRGFFTVNRVFERAEEFLAWADQHEDMGGTKHARDSLGDLKEAITQGKSYYSAAYVTYKTFGGAVKAAKRLMVDWDKTVGPQKIKLNPASSFSWNKTTATYFSKSHGGWSSMVISKVPRERILCTSLTGLGCLDEAEIVVVGNDEPDDGMVILSQEYKIPEDKIEEVTSGVSKADVSSVVYIDNYRSADWNRRGHDHEKEQIQGRWKVRGTGLKKETSHAISSEEQQLRVFQVPQNDTRGASQSTVEVSLGGRIQSDNPALYILRTGNDPIGKAVLDKHPGPGGSDTHDTGSDQSVHGAGKHDQAVRDSRTQHLKLPTNDAKQREKFWTEADSRLDAAKDAFKDFFWEDSSSLKFMITADIGDSLWNDFSEQELKAFCDDVDHAGHSDLAPDERESHFFHYGQHAAHRMVKTWAISSSDSVPTSVALQMTISDEFGLSDDIGWANDKAKKKAKQLVANHGKIIKAFVRRMYKETQKMLEAAGVEELTLYRGMSWSWGERNNPFNELLFTDEEVERITEANDLALLFSAAADELASKRESLLVDNNVIERTRKFLNWYDELEIGGVQVIRDVLEDFVKSGTFNSSQSFTNLSYGLSRLREGLGRAAFDGSSDDELLKVCGLKLNPASSFSVASDIALSFARGIGLSSVVATTVPRARILSTFATGIGCFSEEEVVIIGGDDEDEGLVVLGKESVPRSRLEDGIVSQVNKVTRRKTFIHLDDSRAADWNRRGHDHEKDKHPGPGGSDTHDTGSDQSVHGAGGGTRRSNSKVEKKAKPVLEIDNYRSADWNKSQEHLDEH